MASLESKLLDGKNVGYCSSSDDEEESGWKVANDEDSHQANVQKAFTGGGNTGPKGVLNDYKEFQEESKRARQAKDREILRQAKRGMLQGRKEERDLALQEDDDSGDDLESLRERRARDLRKAAAGRVVEFSDKDQFSSAIDNCSSLLCVLIYEPGHDECDYLSNVCRILAADYCKVRFARARSSMLGMTKNFTEQGIPTLQFYLNGKLVGNFIKLTAEIGLDFDAAKLRKYLKRQHINLTSGQYTTDSEYSTDEELD